MNTLIIAEDNPKDQDYLAKLFPEYQVISTTNGQEALSQALKLQQPLVISDIQMPVLDGINFAKTLWLEKPNSRIVFWSQYNDEIYVREIAKMIPADTVYGYVLKDNTVDTIQRATHAVFEETQCWIDPHLRPIQARVNHNSTAISDAEYVVLIDIALGLTDNQIAQRRYLSRRGVQNRLKGLYNKLGANDHEESHDEAMNLRSRSVSIALRRGLLNQDLINNEETMLQKWFQAQQFMPK